MSEHQEAEHQIREMFEILDNDLIYEDGVICNADGEIVGYYDRPEGVEPKAEPWMPTDADGVDFVLDLFAQDDAEILAFEARKRALIENIDSAKRRVENRREGRENWYRAALEKVAREYLDATGWKSKTLTVAHGKVSFHLGRGSVELVSEEDAIAWAEANKPELVHVKKSVLKSELEEHVPEDCPFLRRIPPVERVKFDTGVK